MWVRSIDVPLLAELAVVVLVSASSSMERAMTSQGAVFLLMLCFGSVCE
jgi:hypothetical protein